MPQYGKITWLNRSVPEKLVTSTQEFGESFKEKAPQTLCQTQFFYLSTSALSREDHPERSNTQPQLYELIPVSQYSQRTHGLVVPLGEYTIF